MPKWTSRQLEAITARNRDILVSAAAGSGKTAVLIERIVSLLAEGLQLDRLLVVTFTHAAADEMKERLTDLLGQAAEKNPALRAQYAMLGRADISTLHSFCARLVKQHFQAAGTDPLSKLADDNQAQELLNQALDEVIDQAHETPSAAFASLTDRFKEPDILQMVLSLYRFIMSMDAPFAWLESAVQMDETPSLYDHPWYLVMKNEAGLLLQGARDLLLEAAAICRQPDGPLRYTQAIQDDLTVVDLLQSALSTQPRFTWNPPAYTRLPSKKPPAEEDPDLALLVKDGLRKQAKDTIAQALALLPQDAAQAQAWMQDVLTTQPQLRALADLVRALSERYQELKAQKTLWDFNDLEHLALKALQDERVYHQVSKQYDAIFVDEYQDVSRIQEAIITRLRREDNSLFMVGDVKQSIYRFRLADPGLFLSKYRSFDQARDAVKRLITLKENFRSTKNILQAVNLVFDHAMRENATEIAYDDEARLSTLKEDEQDERVELWLLQRDNPQPLDEEADLLEAPLDEEEDEDNPDEEGNAAKRDKGEMERAFVYEARLIARRIKELLGTPIVDGDSARDIQYRDFAILLRSAANRASDMADILNQANIPTYSDAEGEFYTQSDVRDVLNILQVVDNPYQDIPLLSALSCPAFGFSPSQLADIRLLANTREIPFHQVFFETAQTDPACQKAADTLSRWRLMASNLPLPRFLSALLRESGLYTIAGAKEDGELRRANLRILVSRAESATDSMNLADFVQRALNAVKQKSRDRSASLGMNENVVRIMTMHKSKGLQFPIVILPDLASSFSGKRFSAPLRMDAMTGLAIEQIDPQIRTRKDGFGMQAMKIKKNREELSEEARLLYVGMTRAKQRLMLIGAMDKKAAALKRWALPSSDYSAGSAKSMLDWVCNPLYEAVAAQNELLYDAPNGSRWHIRWQDIEGLAAPQGALNNQPLPVMPDNLPTENPFLPLESPAPSLQKSSVTALLARAALKRLEKQQADAALLVDSELLEQEEETPEDKRQPLQALKPLRPLWTAGKEQQLTGAQRGAAAHKALCALDIARLSHLENNEQARALRETLDGLVTKGILRTNEREAVDETTLLRFMNSDLARRLADSPERHSEWPFTLQVETGLLIQGVLDACFVEDNQWVLVDYKTDWGEQDEILGRYRDQMRWYMRALRDITGLPVKEAWLYLLRSGQTAQVTEIQPITLEEMGL